MTKCQQCHSRILFSPTHANGFVFCSASCSSAYLPTRVPIPDAVLAQRVTEVYNASCGRCGRTGPVDAQVSHWVWSAVLFTRWGSTITVSCRTCARVTVGLRLLVSLLVGWWGCPWGLIVTPVQVARNIAALFSNSGANGPSPLLRDLVRAELAASYLAGQQIPGQRQQPPSSVSHILPGN